MSIDDQELEELFAELDKQAESFDKDVKTKAEPVMVEVEDAEVTSSEKSKDEDFTSDDVESVKDKIKNSMRGKRASKSAEKQAEAMAKIDDEQDELELKEVFTLPVSEAPKEDVKVEVSKGVDVGSVKSVEKSTKVIDVERFTDETKLTDANLDDCMLNQSSLMAFYVAESARATAFVAKQKLKFEVLEAGLYNAYRKQLAEEGEKVTEKAIENAVRLDKKWQSAKEDVIEAQMLAEIVNGFVQSLKDRKDMMIQKGSDRREEYKGKVRIMQDAEEKVQITSKATDVAKRALNKD